MARLILLLLLLQSVFIGFVNSRQLFGAFSLLDSHHIKELALLSEKAELEVSGALLSPILVPRVSGTPGNAKVRDFLINFFTKELHWPVELDEFEDDTPNGRKKFVNIVATKKPTAIRKLVLAAHYDSKYFADFDFIGATDSAGPCAILLQLARVLNPLLNAQPNATTTLQIIFFDGEEAFKNWEATDSLYGSRHLAQKWEKTYAMGSDTFGPPNALLEYSILNYIDAFILLDLLGDPSSSIWNYNFKTSWIWNLLVDAQNSLFSQKLLSTTLQQRMEINSKRGVFEPERVEPYSSYMIDDDHRPFRDRGVPIVHLIPAPFPSVWHKQSDDATALDPGSLHDISLILRVVVVQLLGLTDMLKVT